MWSTRLAVYILRHVDMRIGVNDAAVWVRRFQYLSAPDLDLGDPSDLKEYPSPPSPKGGGGSSTWTRAATSSLVDNIKGRPICCVVAANSPNLDVDKSGDDPRDVGWSRGPGIGRGPMANDGPTLPRSRPGGVPALRSISQWAQINTQEKVIPSFFSSTRSPALQGRGRSQPMPSTARRGSTAGFSTRS